MLAMLNFLESDLPLAHGGRLTNLLWAENNRDDGKTLEDITGICKYFFLRFPYVRILEPWCH